MLRTWSTTEPWGGQGTGESRNRIRECGKLTWAKQVNWFEKQVHLMRGQESDSRVDSSVPGPLSLNWYSVLGCTTPSVNPGDHVREMPSKSAAAWLQQAWRWAGCLDIGFAFKVNVFGDKSPKVQREPVVRSLRITSRIEPEAWRQGCRSGTCLLPPSKLLGACLVAGQSGCTLAWAGSHAARSIPKFPWISSYLSLSSFRFPL